MYVKFFKKLGDQDRFWLEECVLDGKFILLLAFVVGIQLRT